MYYFNDRNRKFNKKLNRIKKMILDNYLNQYQVRQLLPTDRRLLNKSLESKRFHQNNQRITRTGTFNDQHQFEIDTIRSKIHHGFFCLICSNNDANDLCHLCQKMSEILDHRSLPMSQIYIGLLVADKPTVIDCIFGKRTINIRNSCFCNRYLLELYQNIDINTVLPVIYYSYEIEQSIFLFL